MGQDPARVRAIRVLERRLAELRARLPKHSVPPAMMLELDELEAELLALRGKTDRRPADVPEEG